MTDPDDVTLAAYETAAGRYAELNAREPVPTMIALLDRLVDLVGNGHVLELGSGTGMDAAYLERSGPRVTRTDATVAFLELMRADGHEARRLDARVDDLGGPYDAVYASAMLLHLDRAQVEDVLGRARRAVVPGGILAITLKEGDGDAWSDAKLGLPRHFTYWREPGLRDALERTGWTVLSLEHIEGQVEPWLYVLARADG